MLWWDLEETPSIADGVELIYKCEVISNGGYSSGMNVYEVNCGCEHHQYCYLLRHPGEVCQRAPSAIEEASSVCDTTNTNNSRGTLCTNAHLVANRYQLCRLERPKMSMRNKNCKCFSLELNGRTADPE
jgi:hypothetical protein